LLLMRCTRPETAFATITHCAWAATAVKSIVPVIRANNHLRVVTAFS
jgi:hypothetical protein